MNTEIRRAMDAIREQGRDMDEERYEKFLDQLKFEIEQEIELCGWRSTESDE